MAGVYTFLSYTGTVFALLTAVSAAYALIRRRDAQRWDILFVSLAFALPSLLRGTPLRDAAPFLILTQPLLLVRLVTHFRNVPPASYVLAVLLIAIGAVAHISWPLVRPPALDVGLASLSAGVVVYCAGAFFGESRSASGVSGRRLAFAALGSACLATVRITFVFAALIPWLNRPLGQFGPALVGVMLTCFYFAFSPPRRLKSQWQRGEQARYLSGTAERDAEDRGRQAAADLTRAAASAVNNAAVLVALREMPDDARPLVVRASTIPALVDVPLRADEGFVARVLAGQPADAAVAECDTALAARLDALGIRVLGAPIGPPPHVWGLVLAVQRRGSLFPEDDLVLLTQFAKYAAMALDHAQLVADRRARERRAADRRLREVESRMSVMLDSIKDYALFVIDGEGRIVSWQPGAENLFGYAAAAMRDAPAAPLFERTAEQFAAWLDEARATGYAESEGPCRRADGSRFTGITVIRRLTGDDDLDGFVAVTHDVTEHRDLEERLRQSEKLEAIGLLAGGIAHDFNNLLTAILGYADLLQADCAPSDPRLRKIEEIQRAGERAASLTQQLLAFSRQQTLQPSVLQLSELIERLRPILGRLAGDRVVVVDALDPDLWPILGDRLQLERTLVNLVTNARDAMPGGGEITIRTSNRTLDGPAGEVPPGDYVMLEVHDTGAGMEPEVRARIFEPFFTTKAMGRGVGLGLATVYGIVKQLSGTIEVQSAPGRGAAFRLFFPRTMLPAEIHASPATPVSDRAPQPTLLLVEDDPAVLAFLRHSLERDGFRVLAADHSTSAIELATVHADPIALVISDLRLPDTSGTEFVQALSRIRPGVPALYISGQPAAGTSLPETGYFLQKPFSSADLLARVHQILTHPS